MARKSTAGKKQSTKWCAYDGPKYSDRLNFYLWLPAGRHHSRGVFIMNAKGYLEFDLNGSPVECQVYYEYDTDPIEITCVQLGGADILDVVEGSKSLLTAIEQQAIGDLDYRADMAQAALEDAGDAAYEHRKEQQHEREQKLTALSLERDRHNGY